MFPSAGSEDAVSVPSAQEALVRRFDGLLPDDFGDNVMFCAPDGWYHPQGLKDAWLGSEPTSDFVALVAIADPSDPEHVNWLRQAVEPNLCTTNLPPVVCFVTHFIDQEKSGKVRLNTKALQAEHGFDGVIEGDVFGFDLALAVRAQILQTQRFERVVYEHLCNCRVCSEDLSYMQASIHWMLWEQPVMLRAFQLPPVDSRITEGIPTKINGATVAKEPVFETALGNAFAVLPAEDEERQPNNENPQKLTLLALEKGRFTCIQDMGSLRRMLLGMRSSNESKHANIAYLRDVRHSPSHLVFTMEYAGDMTLRQMLTLRESGDRKPLDGLSVISICRQVSSAMVHVHEHAGLAHADLRPENIGIMESGSGVTVKLFGFQNSIVCKGEADRCRLIGTAPFIAPEVFANRGGMYDAQAADAWSMGVIILELLCGQKSVNTFFGIDGATIQVSFRREWRQKGGPDHGAGDTTMNEIEAADIVASRLQSAMCRQRAVLSLVSQHSRPELRRIFLGMRPIVAGMLRISPETRWTMQHAKATIEALEDDTQR